MKKTVDKEEVVKVSKHTWTLSLLGIVCLLIALFLGFRIFNKPNHFPHPLSRETNISLIQTWMTLPYISRTYGVPEDVLFEKLKIDDKKYHKQSVDEIAKNNNKDSQVVLKEIQNIITQFQDEHKTPPPR